MSKPDTVTVKDTSQSFTPAPEGQHLAVAVDVIDLGERVETYQGADPQLRHKVAIVYQIDETNPDTGKRFEIAVEKTASFHARSGLRKWVESWRGKAYSDEEAKTKGAPLHKMVGVNGLIVVEHRTSQKGRVYGLASNITPKPKSMNAIEPLDYERAEFWTKRKEEYATAAAAFKATVSQNGSAPPPSEPPPDEDDDLPF